MWCPLSDKTCQTTGCTGLYKLCQGSLNTISDNPMNQSDKPTREKYLEEQIKQLEQENTNLRTKLFNITAAVPPYNQY